MRSIAFSVFFLVAGMVLAQDIIVMDADTKEPIANVAVFNKDKSITALTDGYGRCSISGFGGNELVTFKHIGYETGHATRDQIRRQRNKMYLVMKREELAEVVMSVSKWQQQKKDIPHKIASINAREIAFAKPQTSADLLQGSGKVFVQKSQLGGGSPMIRGFATNRLLLTVDGVRMNNAIFRSGNLQNVISIDPFTIKNTEVIFGPGSVIYGSDAMGGVMNFYTKTPFFSSNDSLLVTGNAHYRYSTANHENTGHVDINLGKNQWALLTSLSHNHFDDLKMGSHGPASYLRNTYVTRRDGNDVVVANPDPKVQLPSGYAQWSLMQKARYRPNNVLDFQLGLHYSTTSDYPRYDRLIRPNGEGDGFHSAEWYYGPQRWLMVNSQVNHNGKNKFYDGLRITTAYQKFTESRYDRDFGDDYLFYTGEDVNALSQNVDFENKRIGNLRLYYGAGYVFNRVSSKGTQTHIGTQEIQPAASRYPDGATWQTTALYINGEYKAKPNLTLLSGLRYSHVWINAKFDNTFYDFPFDNADLDTGALTGSFGFSWLPSANIQVTWNGSTGFRAPNIDDIGKVFDSEPGSVVVPNPDLQPEYAYNTEIGIKKNIKDKWVLKGAAFYTYLVDALVRRDFTFNGESIIDYQGEPSNVQAIQNAANAYVYGFEVGLDAYMTENWSMEGNLTLTKGREKDGDGAEFPMRHVPPTFGDVHLRWKNQRWRTDLFLNFNGEIPYGDLAPSERSKEYIYLADENGNPFSPSWYTLNFRSQYQINNRWEASLNLENITDQRYRTYSSGIVAPGMNWVLALGYRF
ncbi:MAG: TonB-dependent receptor [Flavobacteriaceae bacterium]